MILSKIERAQKKPRQTKPVFYLIFEGGKKKNQTEKNFFAAVSKEQNRVIFKPYSGGTATDLQSMIGYAKQCVGKIAKEDRLRDRVLVFFDLDMDPRERKKRIQLALKNETDLIRFIPSSPCFEIWYLLHFEYTSAYIRSFEELEPRLKKYIPDYEKSKAYLKKLNGLRTKAVENCRKLFRDADESDHQACFQKLLDHSGTIVYQIIEQIFDDESCS